MTVVDFGLFIEQKEMVPAKTFVMLMSYEVAESWTYSAPFMHDPSIECSGLHAKRSHVLSRTPGKASVAPHRLEPTSHI